MSRDRTSKLLRRCGLLFGISVLLTAGLAAAQAEISALARGIQPLTVSLEIRYTRFASFTDEQRVRVGTVLEPGDMLASISGSTDMELTCPGGSVMRFSGDFRVLIDAPTAGKDCAVNFLSGTLDVLTNEKTEVNVGGILLGTEGTRYTLEVHREPEGVDQRCAVHDGKVRWSNPRAAKDRWLIRGRRLDLEAGRVIEVEIDDNDRKGLAARSARFDVVQAQMRGAQLADPDAVVRSLETLHYQVLSKPRDKQRRLDLARAQIEHRGARDAVYHLSQAGIHTAEQMRRNQIDVDRLNLPSTRQPPAEATAPDASNPFWLMEQRRYPEAQEIFQKRILAGSRDSRDYCGLARCFQALEGASSQRAQAYADRAISFHARDRKLSESEERACRHLLRR